MTNRKIRLYLLGRLWCAMYKKSFNCVLISGKKSKQSEATRWTKELRSFHILYLHRLLATFAPLERSTSKFDFISGVERKQSGKHQVNLQLKSLAVALLTQWKKLIFNKMFLLLRCHEIEEKKIEFKDIFKCKWIKLLQLFCRWKAFASEVCIYLFIYFFVVLTSKNLITSLKNKKISFDFTSARALSC